MSLKKLLNVFLEYGVLGTKILIAFATVLFKSIYLSYLYFVFDIISSFYQNFQEGRHRDLSEENFSLLNKASKKTKQDLDRIAKEQKVFYSDLKPKQTSLNLLNKLLNESIIRERDLLALTSNSEFYQLFIYSASFSRIAKTLKITPPKRKYPIFLQELGFARLGKNSPSFLINKNNLKEENLKEIKEFKKFLDYHLSRIKKEEWKDFLKKVKAKDRGKYERLNNRGLKTSGFLKTNFLLTQTNMNVTNIGLVDAERIGLGDVYNNDNIIQQIIQGSKIGKITPNNELKVKIKKAFEKQDISLLLEGINLEDRDKIDLNQDSIKQNLKISSILELSNISDSDLKNELVKISLSVEQAKIISKKIILKASGYKKALEELRINI